MTSLLSIVASAGAGALVAALLMPLTRIIPLGLLQGWRQEMAEELNHPLSDSDFKVSLPWKVGMILVGGVLCALLAYTYGLTVKGGALCAYFLGLLLLAVINSLKHQLLPDKLVLPLLWAGLVYSALVGQSAEHVYGAAAGYMVPFVLLHIGKASTGKVLIAYGDLPWKATKTAPGARVNR